MFADAHLLEQILDRCPAIVDPRMSLRQAIAAMKPLSPNLWRDYAVVVEDAQVLGILTSAAIVALVAGENLEEKNWEETLVGTLVSPTLVMNLADIWDTLAVQQVMTQNRLHYLPILDATKQLAGVVSLIELLGAQQSAQTTTRESDIHCRELLDGAVLGMAFLQPDGQWTYLNQQFCMLLGYSETELRALTFADFTHPDDLELSHSLMAQLTAGHRANFSLEKRYIRKDGTHIWSNTTVSAVRDTTGEFHLCVVTIQDISDRKAQERVLRQYERIVSATPDCIALIDRHYIYQVINQAYVAWHNKPASAIVGHSVSDLLGETLFQSEIKPRLDRCLQGTVEILELWVDYTGVGRRYVRGTYAPYVELDGTIAGVTIGVTDLTDLKLADEALRQSETRYRQIVETQSDLVLRSTNDTTITFANVALCRMLGQPLENVVGLQWCNFVPAEDWGDILRKIENLHPDRPTFEMVNRDRRGDGQMGWTQWINQGIFNQEGQLVEIQSVGRDITALCQAEMELRAQQQFIEQIADSTLAILYVYDLQLNRNTYVNPQIEVILGYAPAEIQAMGSCFFSNLVHPEDLPRVMAAYQRCFTAQDGDVLETEYRMRHRNGTYRWLLSRDRVLHHTIDGTPRQVLGVATDITLLKETQFVLQQQAARERLVAEIAQRVRRSFDLDTILTTTVAEVRHLLQVDRAIVCRFAPDWQGIVVAESVADAWLSILDLEIADSFFIDAKGQVFPPGTIRAVENVITAEFSPCYVELMARLQVRAKLVVPIHQGDALWGLLVVHHCATSRPWQPWEGELLSRLATQVGIAIQQSDLFNRVQQELADRKAAEEGLKQRDAILQKLSDQIPGVIYQYRLYPDGRSCFPYASEGIRDIYEVTPKQVRESAAAVFAVLHPDDLEYVAATIEESARRFQIWHAEYRVVLPQKGLRWLEGQATPELMPDGSILWHGYIWDISDRKRAEETLRISEAKFRNVFETAAIGISLAAPDGKHLSVNPALCHMLGYSEAELLAKSYQEITYPDDLEADLAYSRRLQSGEISYFHLEKRYKHRNGHPIWILLSVSMVFDLQHQPLYDIAVVQNIDDRKQAEVALRASEEQRRLALDLTNTGSWDFDTIAGDAIWSDSHYRLMGLVPGEAPSTYETWRDRVHPDDLAMAEAAFAKALASHTPLEVEYRVVHLDGTVRWVLTKGQGIYDATGHAVRMVGVMIDVSDRKRIEAALQQLNRELEQRVAERTQQLQLALSAAQMGTWERNLITGEQYWSPENYELLGFQTNERGNVLDRSGREISEKPTTDLFFRCMHPDDREPQQQRERQAIAQHEPYESEHRIIWPDGTVRWRYSRGAYVFDDAGQPIKLTGISLDITDRKEAEMRLQHQAEMDQLLAATAQRINQSLRLEEAIVDILERLRDFLQTDRAIVYRMFDDSRGIIEREAVLQRELSLLGRAIEDPCLHEIFATRFGQDYITALPDRETATLLPCYEEFLRHIQVRAHLAVPILQTGKLWGLLLLHQCHAPRPWQSSEIDLCRRIALQIGIATQKEALYLQLESELRHKEILIKEVHHRVKNNLQVISSLLNLQSTAIDNPDVRLPFLESQRRIRVMATIHERLYRSGNLASLNFAAYIGDLVHDVFQSYLPMGLAVDWRLDIADVEIELDRAIPCGLIVNELVSNAIKYAFPPGFLPLGHSGEIGIIFSCENGLNTLTIGDNGVGFPETLDFHKTDSLGLQIVRALTRQLGGTIELLRDRGTTFVIIF